MGAAAIPGVILEALRWASFARPLALVARKHFLLVRTSADRPQSDGQPVVCSYRIFSSERPFPLAFCAVFRLREMEALLALILTEIVFFSGAPQY
jgi:hypothetical protein